jgi:hypothetical protein
LAAVLPSGVKKVVKNIDRMRVCPVEHMVKYDRWHAFAQYERPVTAEWLESLPASVVPIRQESDLPEFYRHPHAISLPPVPPPKKTTKHDVDGEKPRPYRAATIDHDAQAEGYNVQAIPLHARGEHIPPVALERPPVAPTDSGITPRGDQDGVGAYFGSQWNNYMSWGVDAQIQASFHHKREACRMCFCCRPCNMAWSVNGAALKPCEVLFVLDLLTFDVCSFSALQDGLSRCDKFPRLPG